MNKLLSLTLLLLFVSTVYSQSCSVLGTTDTNAFNDWYTNGINANVKAAVRSRLNVASFSSPVGASEICGNGPVGTGNIACNLIEGVCHLTTIKLDNLGTNDASKITTFPTQFYLMTRLTTLVLSSNRIATIPNTIGSFKALQFLSINSNIITSTIPTQLASITTLQLLELSSNLIPGTIPVASFQNHASLQSFSVSNNKLSGTIPTQWSSITTLTTFKADSQNPATGTFGGTIPSQWSSLSISTFSVSSNKVTGTIPTQWTTGTLNYFAASNNQLTGTIPTQFGLSTSLGYLYLDSNQLTGTIPTEFGGFVTNMISTGGDLVLNDNSLVGTIPYELMAFPDPDPQVFTDQVYTNLMLGGTNNLCPKVNYSLWGDSNDYVSGCDMCTYSLNNTDGKELCPTSLALTCFPQYDEESYTCLSEYTVYSETKTDPFASTSSAMKIRFSGSNGTTADADYVDTGFAAGTVDTRTVWASKSVGTVWSIYITFTNPNDFWHVDVIKVTHLGVESIYAPRSRNVAIRDNDLLEAEFTLVVKTSDTDGTDAKVYAVLRDNRGYQQNLNFLESAPAGSTITRTLRGYNLATINKVFLGHYSKDSWTVEYVDITKRGVTTRYTWSAPVSRKNRPLGSRN